VARLAKDVPRALDRIRGTRLSVAQILERLGAGMTIDDINESFGGRVPLEAITEALDVAAELAHKPCVAP